MNDAVRGFVSKKTNAIAGLWNKIGTPAKYRAQYENKVAGAAQGVKTVAKASIDHDSVEEALASVRDNLDTIFSSWLETDRDKELKLEINLAAGKDAQSLLIALPAPNTFTPPSETIN